MNHHQVNRRLDSLQTAPNRFLPTRSPCYHVAHLAESITFDDSLLASRNIFGGDNDPYFADDRTVFKNV